MGSVRGLGSSGVHARVSIRSVLKHRSRKAIDRLDAFDPIRLASRSTFPTVGKERSVDVNHCSSTDHGRLYLRLTPSTPSVSASPIHLPDGREGKECRREPLLKHRSRKAVSPLDAFDPIRLGFADPPSRRSGRKQ
jgi:hypothetical protein